MIVNSQSSTEQDASQQRDLSRETLQDQYYEFPCNDGGMRVLHDKSNGTKECEIYSHKTNAIQAHLIEDKRERCCLKYSKQNGQAFACTNNLPVLSRCGFGEESYHETSFDIGVDGILAKELESLMERLRSKLSGLNYSKDMLEFMKRQEECSKMSETKRLEMIILSLFTCYTSTTLFYVGFKERRIIEESLVDFKNKIRTQLPNFCCIYHMAQDKLEQIEL